MNLLIVESPAKVRTISQFIGPGYKLLSTNGHLFTLSRKTTKDHEFGINFKTLEIKNLLIPKKRKIFQEIKEAAKNGDKIIFGTDNDREGEAIAFTVAQKLKIDLTDYNRLIFNEISKDTIIMALQNLQKINLARVNSQKARRLLDRIIGFRAARYLMHYYASAGAGRVQSVVLKFIADREEQIKQFTPRHYKTCGIALNNGIMLSAKTDKVGENVFSILESYSEKPYKLQAIITAIKKNKKVLNPPLPLRTATLVQEAYLRFGFNSAQTISLAQQLYNGVKINKNIYSLITYLRTDSVRISATFIKKAKLELGDLFHADRIQHKNKKFAQDAHEAIRPVYLNSNLSLVDIQNGLQPALWRLYKFIYDRTMAALSVPAIKSIQQYTFDISPINIKNSYANNDSSIKSVPKFNLSISKFEKQGWVKWSQELVKPLKNEQNFSDKALKGDVFRISKCIIESKMTRPPAFYNHASIIKQMDVANIGRPSTYAATIKKLIIHRYIIQKNRNLILTIRGRETSRVLQKHYHTIFNENYTSVMEHDLMKISDSKYCYAEKIYTVNNEMKALVQKACESEGEKKGTAFVLEEQKCPRCQHRLLLIKTRGSDCLICEQTQRKKTRKEIANSNEAMTGVNVCDYFQQVHYLKVEKISRDCDNEGCKGDLVVRRNSLNFKMFVGCSEFPKCHKTINCRRDPELQAIIKNLYPDEEVFF